MTNELSVEEAIKILKGAIKKPNTKDGYLGQAIDMAIKALEQQPCKDCISREAVRKLICQNNDKYGYSDRFHEFTERCLQLPSVTPKTRWIPVSERLPKDLEPVNFTWVNHNPESYYADIKDKPFTATGVYFNGQWYWWSTLCTDILAEYSHNYDDVIDDDIEIIAWMPLPDAYAESEGDENGICSV